MKLNDKSVKIAGKTYINVFTTGDSLSISVEDK